MRGSFQPAHGVNGANGLTIYRFNGIMKLDIWSRKWNVPTAALAELRQILVSKHTDKELVSKQTSEAGIQSAIRLEASRKGARLWRNNVGATYTKEGAFIRYGLANDSKAVNTQIKSADLIGIRPVTIQPWMVGHTIGQFLSREVKAAGWKYTGTEREQAQLAWAEIILALGGDASFAIGEGTI